jgi:hypothetical protein
VVSGSRARAGRVVWFVVGLLARAVGAGVLFWLVFPLWLGIFWSVQGYPPTLGDFARWYALGAFNAAPIVATVGVSILLIPSLAIRLSSLPPSLRFPPLREGNRALSVPPAGRGNLKEGVKENRYANKEARRISGIGTPLVSALLYTLLVPPVAYALLLMYAEMWQYRAWDAMTPTLVRAYGLVGGAAFGVGWAVGWSVRPSRRRAPAGAVARRD